MGETASSVVKQHSSQLTPTPVGTRVVTSSQEGSQSVTQPGLSPVLAQYKTYLQSCYKARALAPADKYLPTLQAPYINLAMIKRGHHGSDARDEFTRRTLHGGVDEILASKTPINIEDLLVPEHRHGDASSSVGVSRSAINPSPFSRVQHFVHSIGFSTSLHPRMAEGRGSEPELKPVRFILVEGPPGIGKSIFVWEVCRRWDEIESLRNYHTVVLLKLREKWVLNATKLSDLFRYPFQPKLSQTIAQELQDSNGCNLLLVLDGFDEISHSFHETSVIKSILCRQLLPECTIILTTRPSAKHTLRRVCQPQVDKHVEIIGFTEEERMRYITEVFSKEAELVVNFLKYMFLVPHIKSMMYIPLNCAIIAQVYYESQQSSHHLAIPRTRTQLYKTLTHSLLVRHMKMKESNCEYSDMLPEGLNKEDMEKFKVLAKFAFDSYHKGESKKVTFFKEDIPEGLGNFGFMNESTEMYEGKGVEQTFSFLHLSLQEYLAAWHLAHSFSIDFQVAYHWLALDGSQSRLKPSVVGVAQPRPHVVYKGSDKEEEALISSLAALGESLVEPAVFLSGITGLRSQSEDDRNHWEMYLSHETVGIIDCKVLLRSLYEAQNKDIIPHYFTAETSRRQVAIGSYFFNSLSTPYDCYALSYCLAHSSNQFLLSIGVRSDGDVSLVETLVKGLEDHCTSTTPSVEHLTVKLDTKSEEISNKAMFWLMKAKFIPAVEKFHFQSFNQVFVNSYLILALLQSLVKLQSLKIYMRHTSSQEWLAGLKSLSELRELYISIRSECSPPPAGLECGPVSSRLTTVEMDIHLPSNTAYDLHSSTDGIVDSLLKSVLRSNQITRLCLPNISRETMAGVHSILLHCPSLVSLELKRTRLGYDGILYICSALRNNTSLTHLLIHDDPQVPESRQMNYDDFIQITSLSSVERVALPDKTTCTDFLLELNNILKHNTALKEMDIQSGLFLPLSTGGHVEYHQWTGLEPLQQFNVGAVGSGRSPNLRRSFSSSDLVQPQALLFWDNLFESSYRPDEVDSKRLFSKRKDERKKLFSLPSFTAPDTEVLQSFSDLDPRLKQCLRTLNPNGKIFSFEVHEWKEGGFEERRKITGKRVDKATGDKLTAERKRIVALEYSNLSSKSDIVNGSSDEEYGFERVKKKPSKSQIFTGSSSSTSNEEWEKQQKYDSPQGRRRFGKTHTRKVKGERESEAASMRYDSPGDDEQSDPGHGSLFPSHTPPQETDRVKTSGMRNY